MWAVGKGGRKGGVDCLSVETVLLPLPQSVTQSAVEPGRPGASSLEAAGRY